MGLNRNKSGNHRGLPGVPRTRCTKLKLRSVNLYKPRFDLTGKRFGSLVAISVYTQKDGARGLRWLCECDCGEQYAASSVYLRCGSATECKKCMRKRHGDMVRKHGLCGSLAYSLWQSAKRHAKLAKLEFSITPHDIVIPEICPIFKMKMESRRGKGDGRGLRYPMSPSIDRVNSSIGYVPDNIWVISWRANWIKNNSTPEELMQVANAVWSKTRKTEAA